LATREEPDVEQTLGVEPARRRARRLKKLFAIVIILVAAAFFTSFWRRSSENGKAPKYETQTAERGNLSVSVTATGTLEPTNQVEVGSELSGIIESVDVDYNDRVKVGQVLAKLNTEKLEAQVVKSEATLKSTKANVLQAQANVVETHNELDRLRQVWEKTDKKAPSQHDLDAAEAAFKRAQAEETGATAQVSEAEATLNGNKTDLSKAVIRSPINGIVLTRDIEPGQTVAASLQAPKLFTLAEDLAQMELHVDVDEADVGQVKQGQAADFTVDAYPDRTFQATVAQVRFGSKTVNGVVTYETVLHVDNSDLLLRPGMTATADIMVKKVENVLLIPNIALRFSPPMPEKEPASEGRGITGMLLPHPPRHSPEARNDEAGGANGQKHVWTLKNGSPAAIPVTIGSTDGHMTEVISGDITPGLPLITGFEEPAA
jgi:HlyD family secretion protein